MRLPTGHVVPEGSIAMTNIKKFLSDPELWDQPEQFRPERCYLSSSLDLMLLKGFLTKRESSSDLNTSYLSAMGNAFAWASPLSRLSSSSSLSLSFRKSGFSPLVSKSVYTMRK